jgi:hypothetical protein
MAGDNHVPTTRVGIEDLKVSGGGGGGNIHLWGSSYCWMKNVEAERSSGTSINFDGIFRASCARRREPFDTSLLDSSPAAGRLAVTPQILAAIEAIVVGQLFAGTDGSKRADEGPGHITRDTAVWFA